METKSPSTLARTRVGAVVELAQGADGVRAPDGEFVPRERLGPGAVREVGDDGWLRVHWVGAGFDAWLDPTNVTVSRPDAHLIVVYRRNSEGERTLERYKVISGAGLTHNWTVEWMPQNLVRAVRSDGFAWTFDWYPWLTNCPWLERAQPLHTMLQEALSDEDHAEAATVAELAAK